MIILIGGRTHAGKTLFAQRLIEKYYYPCMSLDHLKMVLIYFIYKREEKLYYKSRTACINGNNKRL